MTNSANHASEVTARKLAEPQGRSLKTMITKKILEENIWAGGDIDGYSRSGRVSDITNEDWLFIDQVLSAITMIRRGLVSDSFRSEHEQTVKHEFDSHETYEFLRQYEMKSEQTS
jgi:hypothetical protein